MRLLDVSSLRRLVSATQEQEESIATLQLVDPVLRAECQPQLRDTAPTRFHVAGVAMSQAVDALQDAELARPVLQLPESLVELVTCDDLATCRL